MDKFHLGQPFVFLRPKFPNPIDNGRAIVALCQMLGWEKYNENLIICGELSQVG